MAARTSISYIRLQAARATTATAVVALYLLALRASSPSSVGRCAVSTSGIYFKEQTRRTHSLASLVPLRTGPQREYFSLFCSFFHTDYPSSNKTSTLSPMMIHSAMSRSLPLYCTVRVLTCTLEGTLLHRQSSRDAAGRRSRR